MRHLALFGVLGALCLSAVAPATGVGQYSVVGPGTLHSDSTYNVAVAVHHTSEPTQLKVGIIGPSYNDVKTVDLQPNEVKNVEFTVPALEQGDYNLTAEGVTGIVFKNTTKLNFDKFSGYTKVQTDKGKYKPGDVVNFRVLFLDENLKPGKPDKDARIWFEDDKRNRIKEYKDIEVTKGVYTNQFKISEYAALGNWRLLVRNGEDYSNDVYFEVEKYVLPKYVVSVDATDRVSVRDGDVHVVVKANYTYGKPVDGTTTVLLSMYSYYYGDDSKDTKKTPPTLIKSTDMVHGKAKFDFNVKEYAPFLLEKTYAVSLTVTATVEENFTGVKINGSSYVQVYPYRYAMNCISYETCSIFVEDKESEVVIKVSLVDDTPVADTKSVVKLIYTEELSERHYWRGYGKSDEKVTTTTQKPVIENKIHTFESHLNSTGFATFKVSLPELKEIPDYMHFYRVEVEYLDEKRLVTHSYQHRKPKKVDPSPSSPEVEEPKKYFKVFVNHPENRYSFNLSETIIITVNSSEPLTYFVYDIIGRGNILHHERVDLPNSEKVYNITLKPTFLLSPYARLYVYYVDENGEYNYAESSVHIDVELQNEIDITAPKEVKPGEEVPLHIKTAPHSFVGLMAVDQSVLLLAGNNDIHAHEFNWRLGRYDTRTPWQGGYSQYPGEQSGVVTMTNADYFYNWTKPDYGVAAPFHVLRTTVAEVAHDKVGMAAPAAAGFSGGSSLQPQNEIAVRKDFSETWIFANIEDTQSEEFTWAKKIPDTITSWVISGFSLNPETGLGITKDTTKVTTFQPFFIAIRLPYSVKRGEVINVPALVFNYLDKDLDVQVTLDNSDGEYEFTEVSNEVINEPKREKTVRVPALSSRGVSFMIRPKVIGNILLKFTAVSPIAGDAIHKPLKVVPEGVTEYANRAYFVNLKDVPEFKETFELALPSEVVPDSEHVEFTVIGDLLGPLLNNLNHLVRMPTGCAEQTTSTLAPNYIVLRYLESVKKLTPTLETKIKYNLETGYQHILSFLLDDGSFTSFATSRHLVDDEKPHGSTWLTSYVVRTLNEAKQHIGVDDKVIEEGLQYLISQQAKNGSFVESNDFFYSPYRKHITLTANVLLTLLQNETLAKTYQVNIDKGFKFILENLEKSKDLHEKTIATYALHKAKHPMAETQLNELKGLAKTDNDRKWWTQDPERPTIHWWRWSFSNDVEITSYILITLLEQDDSSVESVLPIIKWLVAQRNSYGGFSSTQDTVVGLQALTLFAKKAGYEPAVMDITVKANGGKGKEETLKVNEENGLVLQSVELPHKTLSVDFEAKGKGAALVQISYQYNILEKEKKPSFTIKTVINKETPVFKLEMDVCVEYIGEKESSNMALLEISLPSGFLPDEESFKQIKEVPRVRQVEAKESDSVIVVYFESLLKKEPWCVPVEAFKSFAVARQKPASIVLYDYYDTAERATDYYEVVSKMCDICEDDEECKKACQ